MRANAPWKERPYDHAQAEALRTSLTCDAAPLLARLLAARGVSPDELDGFLNPSLDQFAARDDAWTDIGKAAEVVIPFVRARRKIVVFGDYDADGVCATAILVSALRQLGAVAEAFIPERFTEGYGMTAASLARLRKEQPDAALVITVDNGITAVDEIADLKARGVAVVVTDHHLPGEAIPAADAVVDPRIASSAGCGDLCGAGVAFFLVFRLARSLGCRKKISGPLLVLAGLATVADLMPLRGQNRLLVAQALKWFRSSAPLGLRELLDRASRRADALVSRDFSFLFAPRINAAGRMRSARLAYDLLMSDDREVARELARQVDNLNVERKNEEARVDRLAREQNDLSGPAVVVTGEDWHQGVLGIVASRLVETAHVPVAVAVAGHGSVRAPEGYNVHAALMAAASTLVRFGGHASAGGFVVREGAFEEFRRLFTAACRHQQAAAPDAAAILFDGWIAPEDLTVDLWRALQRLEPYGEGNPEPVFGLRQVAISDARTMGGDGRHASLVFRNMNRNSPRAVWWNHGNEVEELRRNAAGRFDVLFTLSLSDFGGEEHVELRVLQVRPAVQ
ncbi:MAG: single-stranded-DNA-specific exonuclease RecJ [Kiritimatiellia bacterium]